MLRRDIEALWRKFIMALIFVGVPLLVFILVLVGVNRIPGSAIEPYLIALFWLFVGLAVVAGAAFLIHKLATFQVEAQRNPWVSNRPSPAEQFREDALRLANKNGVPRATRRLNKYQVGTPRIIVDVGVLVYEHEHDEPHITRHQPLPLDAQFLRPYLQIWAMRRHTVDIAFEFVDASDRVVFRDATKHKLRERRGVTCQNWLPIQGISVDQNDTWSLRAYINDELVADHHLKWGTFRWDDLKAESPADGELSKHLTNALKTGQIDTISLDDLLEPQKIGRQTG